MDSRIRIISITLAFLSSPEQLKREKKGMSAVLNQLLQVVMNAVKSDQYRHDGFHYIRFRDSRQPDQVKMTKLLNTILTTLLPPGPLICENLPSPLHHQAAPQPVPIIIQSTTATFRPINQWTSTDGDILAWFTSNQISIELNDLFNF
ncbi:unnamed protein product [Rotaria sp. Silwood2]|nr:unnamed protein product [Rotaria sp. Silwood2]